MKILKLAVLLIAIAADGQAQTTAPTSDSTAVDRPLTINEMREQRGLTTKDNIFIPKGQWVFGGTASYSKHINDSYSFLVIDDIDSKGYTFKVSPMVSYALGNNMVIGARFIYGRSFLRVDNADVSFGEGDSATNIGVDFYYTLKHSFTTAAIWRQYIPLGQNKRFALFTEMQLAYGYEEGKFAADQPVRGTFETGHTLSLGVSPGIVAFASNVMAIEVSVGVMGISYTNARQVHNQVTVGKLKTSNMNFKVNLFSIGLGVSFYL